MPLSTTRTSPVEALHEAETHRLDNLSYSIALHCIALILSTRYYKWSSLCRCKECWETASLRLREACQTVVKEQRHGRGSRSTRA